LVADRKKDGPLAIMPPLPAAPKFNATPESIAQDTDTFLASLEDQYKAIFSSTTPETACFADTIQPLAQADNRTIRQNGPFYLYSLLSPTEEVQEAARAAETKTEASLHEILYTDEMLGLIQAVMQRGEQLDEEDERFPQTLYRKFVHKGLMIADPTKRERVEGY
jgi:metallopeptidase MepB